MGRRYPNPRLVKMHRSYDAHELSLLFAIHKNTLRAWIKLGLKPIDDRRPALFQGLVVREFLTARSHKARQSCLSHELYCLCCKTPKTPAGNIVDYLPTTERTGNLRGICPDCENLIHRRTSMARLSGLRGVFLVAFPQGFARISETRDPCVKCDSEKG